jgi:lipocalin
MKISYYVFLRNICKLGGSYSRSIGKWDASYSRNMVELDASYSRRKANWIQVIGAILGAKYANKIEITGAKYAN